MSASTFKSIEFVRKKDTCQQLLLRFHNNAKKAVFAKDFVAYKTQLVSVVLSGLPDILERGAALKGQSALQGEDVLVADYFGLFETVLELVATQSWAEYMAGENMKGDTVIFKFMMLFLTDNFFDSWRESNPRELAANMVRNFVFK
jgi:hypothetical protein